MELGYASSSIKDVISTSIVPDGKSTRTSLSLIDSVDNPSFRQRRSDFSMQGNSLTSLMLPEATNSLIMLDESSVARAQKSISLAKWHLKNQTAG
jgi:hypothetical protein